VGGKRGLDESYENQSGSGSITHLESLSPEVDSEHGDPARVEASRTAVSHVPSPFELL
jgi:hypothetical protein